MGGALSEAVMESAILVQILEEAFCVSRHVNIDGKGMNPSVISHLSVKNRAVGPLGLARQYHFYLLIWRCGEKCLFKLTSFLTTQTQDICSLFICTKINQQQQQKKKRMTFNKRL